MSVKLQRLSIHDVVVLPSSQPWDRCLSLLIIFGPLNLLSLLMWFNRGEQALKRIT